MSVRALLALAALGICGLWTPPAAAQLPPLPPAPLPTVPLPPAPLPIEPPSLVPPAPPPPVPLPPPPSIVAPPPASPLPPPPPAPAPVSGPATSGGSGSTSTPSTRAPSRPATRSSRRAKASPTSTSDGGAEVRRTGLADRTRVGLAREDDKTVARATAGRRPVGTRRHPSLDNDDAASFVGSIANPFREAPAWLRPFMIGMLAAALALLQLGALPASAIPWPGAAMFIARRRTALLGAGTGLLGALGVAGLTL
jgi:hypothetical protein